LLPECIRSPVDGIELGMGRAWPVHSNEISEFDVLKRIGAEASIEEGFGWK